MLVVVKRSRYGSDTDVIFIQPDDIANLVQAVDGGSHQSVTVYNVHEAFYKQVYPAVAESTTSEEKAEL